MKSFLFFLTPLLWLHTSLVFSYDCACPCGPGLCCPTNEICYTQLGGPLSCGPSTTYYPGTSTVTKTIVTTITVTTTICPSCSTEVIYNTTGGSYGVSISYVVTTGVGTWVNDLPSTTYTSLSSYTSTISTVTRAASYEVSLSYVVTTGVATWVLDFPDSTSTELSTYTSTLSTITQYPPQVYTVTVYVTQTTYHTTQVSYSGSSYVSGSTYTPVSTTTYTSYSTSAPQAELSTSSYSDSVSPQGTATCAASMYLCQLGEGGGCCSTGYTCGGGSCTTSAAGAGQYVLAQQAPETSGASQGIVVSRKVLRLLFAVALNTFLRV